MGQTLATRLADWIQPPRAGQQSILAVTSSAGSQDIRLCGNQTGNMANADQAQPGLPGHYVAMLADGCDVYVVFGATLASVTGANAPSATQTGVNVAGCSFKIPNGSVLSVLPKVGTDNFMGYVAASGNSGNLRITQASP